MSNPKDTRSPNEIGVIIVDHGSRRAQSNQMLLEVAALFQKTGPYSIVEAAHMEQAEPTIQAAFNRCVARGARLVVIHPYFLLPGRHWDRDIPALAAEAAGHHPGVPFLVTAPLGLDPRMVEVMKTRIEDCLAHAVDGDQPCDVCTGTDKCQVREQE